MTGTAEKAVRVWDTATGIKLLDLADERRSIVFGEAITFTADGRRLVSASFVANTFRAGGERVPGVARLRFFDATPLEPKQP